MADAAGSRGGCGVGRPTGGQHKQIIGTIVDELEALGYVTRQPDPTDRRAKLVVPTERGLAEPAAAQTAITGVVKRQVAVLGSQRHTEFKNALADLATGTAPAGSDQ